MIIVCDASPLIFLAKLDRLDLISRLLEEAVVVLKCVVDEVNSDRATGRERDHLASFLASATIVDFTECAYESRTLSPSDRKTLTYAVREGADWLVADERLLRRVANENGIRMVGTLGLLASAVKTGLLSPAEVKADIDRVVSIHDFRISTSLYQRFLAEIGG